MLIMHYLVALNILFMILNAFFHCEVIVLLNSFQHKSKTVLLI